MEFSGLAVTAVPPVASTHRRSHPEPCGDAGGSVASGLQPEERMSTRGRSKGFTLVELMVVLSVIAILAAIAIPNYSARQGKAFDARIATDVRNAAAGQEAYFLDNLEYSSDCSALPGFKPSEGVVFTECSTDGISYRLTTDHPRSTKTCTWSSVGDPVLECTPKG